MIDCFNQLQDFLGGVVIQRTGRLITKQDIRIFYNGTANGSSLLLASRKLVRKLPLMFIKSQCFQQYVGDKTKTAPKFDGVTVHDITFPTQDRDTLEVPTTTTETTTTTTTTTESTTETTTTTTETTTQTTTTTTTETTTESTTESTEATTAVYKGSETVDVYGYDVKVAVAVDGNGKIISVLDDNTDTQDMFNEMFYSKAIAMFKNFIGKTASELDDVDGISSATYSSNAIRGAVKNALSSIPASLDLSSSFVSGGAVNANSSFAEVALKSSNDSANIFYTTDGTEPNENSNKYDGSIKLTAADITSSSKKVVD